MPRHPDPTVLTLLADASQRLYRTVDSMPEDAWVGPSLLPGWTRSHVVAHLVLNAEGLAAALRGLTRGERTPVYASPEQRDRDIHELAGRSPGDVRTRLLGATTSLTDALSAVPTGGEGLTVERTPRGPCFAVLDVPAMRWREVEIHHVDLDLGVSRSDWPEPFALHLLEVLLRRRHGVAIRARATDVGRVWEPGRWDSDPVVTVTGSASDLGWWLTGRGAGEGLNVDGGTLPQIGAL